MLSYQVVNTDSTILKLMEKSAETGKPIQIKSKKANAILISESEWNDIEETLFLLSIPDLRVSIIQGMSESLESCSEESF